MAGRAAAGHKAKGTELIAILACWENRYELRLLSRWLPRAFSAALLVSLLAGTFAYAALRLSSAQLALLSAAVCASSGLGVLVYTLLFPRPRPVSARYFDIEFGLQERVSTALELLDGRIRTHPEIEAQQIADALQRARQINPRERIRLEFRRGEWAALLILLAAVLAMTALPVLLGDALPDSQPSPALQAAQETVREGIETAAIDTALDDIDRQQLLEALDIALERLQEADISDEEAFAAMSQLEAQIDEIQARLLDGLELDQSALEAAAQALKDFVPPDGGSGEGAAEADQSAQTPALDELTQALDQMMQEMSPEEAQAAAQALQQAAQQTAATSPQLAEPLRNMADALTADDRESLQQQRELAQDALQREGAEQQQRQNAQQMLSDQSDRTQEAARDIAEQQSQQNQQQEAGAPRSGEAELSEDGEERGGQQSGQQSDAAQPGANQGSQSPGENRPGSGENLPSRPDGATAGQGAGEGESSNISLPGSGGEDQGVETANQTTGAGEIRYEALYSPSGITGGGAGDELRLEADASRETLSEGDFDDNPLGEARVSYDAVFSDYQDAASRALESAYVPLGLRDVVRDYFTSLEPDRTG